MKAKKLQARATEKEQKRLHVPTVDRSTGEPAPYVIVVQGPPKVDWTCFVLVRCHSLGFRFDLLMDYAIIGWEVTVN